MLACYIYVGNMQMSHLSPRLTTAAERRRQLDLMFDFLVAGAAIPTEPAGLRGFPDKD